MKIGPFLEARDLRSLRDNSVGSKDFSIPVAGNDPGGRALVGSRAVPQFDSTKRSFGSKSFVVSPVHLHLFYEDLVHKLRDCGVVCAITSGLACVHYGIAETTKDCDLLCHVDAFDKLLGVLSEIRLEGQACRYRGHISPPLEVRWHRGGWTSHFEWDTPSQAVTLDVFGRAVRQSSPWECDLSGLYAGMNVVAEMKRTDRDKDWPFITSLGTEMLRARDPRGWLHLFDAEPLSDLQEEFSIPSELLSVRPVLRLAVDRDARLHSALLAERHFWMELDRFRIRLYRSALRPYVLAMGRNGLPSDNLRDQHAARIECAESTLQINPIAAYGIDRLIGDARDATAAFVQPGLLQWLPNVRSHFTYLEE